MRRDELLKLKESWKIKRSELRNAGRTVHPALSLRRDGSALSIRPPPPESSRPCFTGDRREPTLICPTVRITPSRVLQTETDKPTTIEMLAANIKAVI